MSKQTGLSDQGMRLAAGETSPVAGRLPASAAFALQVSVVVFFLAASAAPTPLYALYQARWGFSPITTTVVFGIYAVAVLAALLTVGSLSDHVGRRPVLLAALAGQAAAMVVFATASGVPELMAARVIQGLATGAAAGAVGAGLLDLHRTRGTLANAVAPITGTATGSLGAGLLVQYLPDPSRLVYLILLVIFAVQAVGVLFMAESSPKRTGALASLRPAFSLPAAVRGPLLRSVPALIALWSLGGLYASLGPALVAQITGQHSFVLGGLSVAVLAGTGAASVLLLRSAPPAAVMLTACIALVAGVGITLVSVQLSSATVFFAGTVVAGPASAPGSRAWSAACCRMRPPISGPACCRSSGWCPTWPWACPRCWPGCSWCTAAASEARPGSTARRSCCWPHSRWPAWPAPAPSAAVRPRPRQYPLLPPCPTTTRSWSAAAERHRCDIAYLLRACWKPQMACGRPCRAPPLTAQPAVVSLSYGYR